MERYEAKLSVMAFIGVFDELMRTVVPVSHYFRLKRLLFYAVVTCIVLEKEL